MDRELILVHDPLFFYAPQPGLDAGKGLVFRNGFTDGLVMGDVMMDDVGVPFLTIDARDGSVIQRVQAGWAVSTGNN